MDINIDKWAKLRKPFPPEKVCKLPKPTRKDNKKGKCFLCKGYHGLPAVHLDYVGHAELTERLLDCDPEWQWNPLNYCDENRPEFDQNGGLWLKLTIHGITRLGYGDSGEKSILPSADAIKEAIGDGLRNAAMRFGCALELWMKSRGGDIGYVDSEGKTNNAKLEPKRSNATSSENKNQKTEQKSENKSPAKISASQKRMLEAMISKSGLNREDVKSTMGVDSISDLNMADMDRVLKMITENTQREPGAEG